MPIESELLTLGNFSAKGFSKASASVRFPSPIPEGRFQIIYAPLQSSVKEIPFQIQMRKSGKPVCSPSMIVV